jgi:hypothetical protein
VKPRLIVIYTLPPCREATPNRDLYILYREAMPNRDLYIYFVS